MKDDFSRRAWKSKRPDGFGDLMHAPADEQFDEPGPVQVPQDYPVLGNLGRALRLLQAPMNACDAFILLQENGGSSVFCPRHGKKCNDIDVARTWLPPHGTRPIGEISNLETARDWTEA